MRRRALAAYAALSLALVSPSWAQGFIAPSAPRREVQQKTEEPKPTIEGIVANAFKTRRPLQLINPLAPAKYGNGRATTSWDPHDPAKPKGFILFGIEW